VGDVASWSSYYGQSLAEFLQINEKNTRETRVVYKKDGRQRESLAESRMGNKSFPKQMLWRVERRRVCTRRLLVILTPRENLPPNNKR
jgi:hypothetical protein